MMDRTLSLHSAARHPSGSTMPAEGVIAMPMELDTAFEELVARPRHPAAPAGPKAGLSRPTILRLRKGGLGRTGTRVRLVAACSAFIGRRATESELFWMGSQ
jgi:hypothetical protein